MDFIEEFGLNKCHRCGEKTTELWYTHQMKLCKACLDSFQKWLKRGRK